ncbi:MAG: hypothetical protein J0L56_02215 [Chitinophagales bacterium]|nr:hypothetical protein [Chitinophagales bacterium]
MRKLMLSFFAISLCFIAVAQQDTTLQQYTGKYKFPEGSVVTEVTVAIENGVLLANSPMGSSELKKTEADVFEIVAYGGTATFKRTEGKVSGVQMIVGDMILEGTRAEGTVSMAVFCSNLRTAHRK